MTLSTIKSPDEIVTLIVNAMQASSETIIDFDVGSIPRAWVDGNLGLGLFLQELFVETEAKSRLATSKGADKLTFGADFKFNPPPAASGTTNCTFSRTSATQQALIPVGSQVQTPSAYSPSGPIVFNVVADSTNPAYNAGLNAYVMAPSVFNLPALVQCATPGSIGNVAANTISQITSPITGVSSVTNPSAVVNGSDVPDGVAYDNAFADYIEGLGNGTVEAYVSAINQVQAGLDVKVLEDEDFNLQEVDGLNTIIFDDGTGTPPDGLVAAVYNAVYQVRSAGIRIAVFKPSTVSVNISASIKIPQTGYNFSDVQAAISAALTNYFSGTNRFLKIGVSLSYSKVYEIIYDASPAVLDVTNLLLNSATSNVSATDKQKLIPGTFTFSEIT